ncbi:hypothetical protein [Spirosoma radiotolerans]|uniref:Uncharacterized protein n=1 Tax=Spirosoma radiotolerans TaxID=1379870 RepID=A0A0E3ZY91_9BACT|nr:hypothetical protein [Spirosoma radiotolerans]AKD56838.1 hypothetical protein SD10_19950 [Spirosoma radiotolerans]
METSHSELSTAVLLADYERWLNFVTVSRSIIRTYDRQLVQIGKRHADLSPLSQYLRECMHQRSQFFGELALLLTEKVAQLRVDLTNEELIRKLAQAHLAMQTLIAELTDTFSEIEESYRSLAKPAYSALERIFLPICDQ